MTYGSFTHILFCKMYYIWRHKRRNISLPCFVSVSLIDRRGFLPEDESVQTAATDIELPAVATKSEINVVGGSSQLAFGLQESPSVVPVYPNSHHNSSSAWQKPCCLPLYPILSPVTCLFDRCRLYYQGESLFTPNHSICLHMKWVAKYRGKLWICFQSPVCKTLPYIPIKW